MMMTGLGLIAALAQLAVPPAPMDADTRVTDYLTCLDAQGISLVSAHRGGPAPGFPENAIETFENTLAQGGFLLELDIRQSADGVFVLMHDETLERTTTGIGRVDETVWSDLRRLRLVDNDGQVTGFAVPSLAEALAWAEGRTLLQLDVKPGVDIAELARFVAAAGARDRAAVIAYSVEDALAAAAADPDISVSVEITDIERLDRLVEGGLEAGRLMAWTGVAPEPRPELWTQLDEAGVVAAFGALWYIDREVEESGDAAIYAELAELGADVISSDLHRSAYRSLETRQATAPAIARCTARLSARQD